MAFSKINPFSINLGAETQKNLSCPQNLKAIRCLDLTKLCFLFSSVLFCTNCLKIICELSPEGLQLVYIERVVLHGNKIIIIFIADQYVTGTIYMPASKKT